MATSKHTTTQAEATSCHGIDFSTWPSDALIKYMDDLADEINEKGGQIAAIAYGGTAYAGSLDSSRDPIDVTCEKMFDAIISLSQSASSFLQMKDAIAELARRSLPTPAAKKGGAA